eukprot:gene5189-8795_t
MFLKRKLSGNDEKLKNEDNKIKKKKLSELKELDSHLTNLLFDESETFFEKEIKEEKEEEEKEELQCVWKDEYIEEIEINELKGNEYEEKMRKKFLKNNSKPKWLEHFEKNKKEINENEFIFGSNERFMKESEITLKKMINITAGNKIEDLKFHPSSNILELTFDKRLQFNKIDQENNPVIEKYNLPKTIESTCFSNDGKELILTLKNSIDFYIIDLTKGTKKKGQKILNSKNLKNISIQNDIIAFSTEEKSIQLISSKTKFKIGELRMNENINNILISNDSNYLYSTGKEGNVYIFDLRKQRPLNIFNDQGSFNTTSLDISNDYFVTGSSSGVVNFYNSNSILNSNDNEIKPFKSFMNLTTSINQLKFNHQSSILSIISNQKKNAYRLMKMNNFEIIDSIHKGIGIDFIPTLSDFSFNDEFYGIATDKKVKLFQINSN